MKYVCTQANGDTEMYITAVVYTLIIRRMLQIYLPQSDANIQREEFKISSIYVFISATTLYNTKTPFYYIFKIYTS